jgi:hypothetical protein
MALVGNRVLSTLVGASLMTGLAHAATTEDVGGGASVTKVEKSFGTRILEKTSFSYFGFVSGPAVTRISNYGIDGSTGSQGGPIGISNQFRANVGLNDKGLYIGPFITAKFQPTVGQTMTLTDSGFRVGHTSMVKIGAFNWATDARFLAPISQGSRDRDVVMNLQNTHSMNYVPAGSRFAVGVFTSIMKSFLGPNGAKRDLDLYFGPNFTYKASDTVSMTTYFEIYPFHTYGEGLNAFKNDPFDINPMVNFQINKNKVLTLSPGVVYYPSLGTLESLSYMAYIFAAL